MTPYFNHRCLSCGARALACGQEMHAFKFKQDTDPIRRAIESLFGPEQVQQGRQLVAQWLARIDEARKAAS